MLGHLALIAVFIVFKLWVLIRVVSFGCFFAGFLSRGCTIQQHFGLCPNVPDWRVSCHSVRFGPLTSYLYWNMNYHAEHHMYAAVPFFNLPRLREALEQRHAAARARLPGRPPQDPGDPAPAAPRAGLVPRAGVSRGATPPRLKA